MKRMLAVSAIVAAGAALALTVSGNLSVQGLLTAGSVDFSSASRVRPAPPDSPSACQEGELRAASPGPGLLLCGPSGAKIPLGASVYDPAQARQKFFHLTWFPALSQTINSSGNFAVYYGNTPVSISNCSTCTAVTTTPSSPGFAGMCLDMTINASSQVTYANGSMFTYLGLMSLGTGSKSWYYEIQYARVTEPGTSTLRNAGTVMAGLWLDSSIASLRLASGNYTIYGLSPSLFGISNPGDGNLHSIKAWTVSGQANRIYVQVDSGPVRSLCNPQGSCDGYLYYASSSQTADLRMGLYLHSGNQNGTFAYRVCKQLFYADLR